MSNIKMLYRDGSFDKFNGIIECVKSNLKTAEIIERLKELKNDTTTIAGHPIADFSMAALDILGIEKYDGDDNSIKQLIESKFDF